MVGKRRKPEAMSYSLPFPISTFETRREELSCPACQTRGTLFGTPASPTSCAFVLCRSCKCRVDLATETCPPSPPTHSATIPATAADSQGELARLQQTVQILVARMNHYDKILAENAMLKEENEALKAQLDASTRTTTSSCHVGSIPLYQHPLPRQPGTRRLLLTCPVAPTHLRAG